MECLFEVDSGVVVVMDMKIGDIFLFVFVFGFDFNEFNVGLF